MIPNVLDTCVLINKLFLLYDFGAIHFFVDESIHWKVQSREKS